MESNGKAALKIGITPVDHVIFTELDGTEGVLVDLKTKNYYRLNETAMFIWRGLERHLEVEEIASDLCDRYDIAFDRSTASVERALRAFETYKLVSQADRLPTRESQK